MRVIFPLINTYCLFYVTVERVVCLLFLFPDHLYVLGRAFLGEHRIHAYIPTTRRTVCLCCVLAVLLMEIGVTVV